MRLSLRQVLVSGPLFLVVFGGAARAQTPPATSPFLPADPAVSASHAQSNEPYQLSAIGVIGEQTFVSIYEAAERHSRWVAVGASLGDLHVVSCDIEAEQAVVTVGGQTRTLTLPKPAVATAAAPAPAAGTSPATASGNPADNATAPAAEASDEDKAREARMLVTDLLEIGMQQRKAYEEAQRKAAAERNGEKPAEPNAN